MFQSSSSKVPMSTETNKKYKYTTVYKPTFISVAGKKYLKPLFLFRLSLSVTAAPLAKNVSSIIAWTILASEVYLTDLLRFQALHMAATAVAFKSAITE